VLILVHLESLVSDLYQRIGAVKGRTRPGIVMAGANDLGSEIVVASVQSMRQPERLKGIGRRDVVIIDEAHHAVADGYGDVLRAVLAYRVEIGVTKPILSLGLTATPYRAGSGGETEGLGDVYDALVYSYTMAQGIADGVLVAPQLTRYDIQTAGSAGEAVKRISSPEICDVVAAQWQAKLMGRHTLAFGVDRKHAEELAAAVRRQGGRAQAVDGGMGWQVVQERLRLFREGKLDVLASCDLIREGFDMPVADALMICRPSDSPIVGIQMLGRGLRTHPGKRDCLVLDFTGGRMDLDLDRSADLATNAVEEDVVVKPRPLAVGETVVHRHRGELGLGGRVGFWGGGARGLGRRGRGGAGPRGDRARAAVPRGARAGPAPGGGRPRVRGRDPALGGRSGAEADADWLVPRQPRAEAPRWARGGGPARLVGRSHRDPPGAASRGRGGAGEARCGWLAALAGRQDLRAER
jgi:type I site-specific restriction endonuclease